ncbi:DUF726-domain-containing protein [Fragilariopsis cylindrus CCMP1102]|uniref:DUF726-domain-containing protein n=1 Tax=Fragilariopsis cylindrus CCMP1102 TaxID=635003 RepID=A0A1E7F0Z0_9STRA|nr:DUF726-domain-containing protein [Fragilariopsis cylindrus CCMP1102]|eukprot:OEU11807.1 DUF726-domain-containing protein [Fragilariopsis cylindrus CCMP1102]
MMKANTNNKAGGGTSTETTTAATHTHTRTHQKTDKKKKNHNISTKFFRSNDDPIPSEQDRKATIGCLAAVLNIMFTHQLFTTIGSSGRVDDDVDGNGNGNGNVSNNKRTTEFQKELLLMSTELLYLNPATHAEEYLSILTSTTKTTLSSEQLLLDPFLSSFSSAEAGFQCISLLLFRFLLLSNNNNSNDNVDSEIDIDNDTDNNNGEEQEKRSKKTIIGYDARVRYAFKYLSVSILKYWDLQREKNNSSKSSPYYAFISSSSSATSYATRKFEALEDSISYRLFIISSKQQQIIFDKAAAATAEQDNNNNNNNSSSSNNNPCSLSKLKCHSNPMQKKKKSIGRNVFRGLKIGGAAVVGGTLIAITGGIAVPAIVGGIAAIAGMTASFTAIVGISLLIIPATVTVFGVGSSILVATKMSKRTKGLTEFDIIHHPHQQSTNNNNNIKQQQQQPKLSRTICINGWLTDEYDFERPFGITPKLLTNKKELLCRFCSIYAPQVIPECDNILQEWKGKENELWDILKSAYGKDPNSLLPIDNNENTMMLSIAENKSIDSMIRNMMGIQVLSLFKEEEEKTKKNNNNNRPLHPVNLLDDVLSSKNKNDSTSPSKKSSSCSNSNRNLKRADDDDVVNNKKYRSYMAWDFQSKYSGMELYTIAWEKDLLMQLRGSARDVQKDLATKGAELAIKKTIFASLMTAVAIPATLLGLTGIIDEKWTLVAERADEAGILLAESLLKSDAGHRPVNLIGISFGARMIISCLSELARHQKKWEKHQQQQQQENNNSNGSDSQRFSNNSSNRRGSSALLKAGDSIRKSISSSVASKLGGGSSSSSSSTSTVNNPNSIYLREPASIVENVILMGCPSSIKSPTWKTIRGMVAGKLINCYSKNDMMLALMYRIKNPTKLLTPPAGITEIKNTGIINYDVSNLVSNHGEYRLAVNDILDLVGFDQPGFK